MSYKTPQKPVTHGVLKRYGFFDKSQNEMVRKSQCLLFSIFVFFYRFLCTSPFFFRKFPWQRLSRMFSFDILRGKLVRDWPKFDPLAHAFRLTAVVIWGSVFKHYNFCEANTQMHANVCNLFKFKITFSQLSKRWKISHKLSLTGSQTKTRTKIYGYTFSDKDKQLVGTTDQKIEYLKIALDIEEQGCRWGLLLRWFIFCLFF